MDQDSRRFAPESLTGKLVLYNFVYTGCSTVCPLQTRALAEMRRTLPDGLRRDVRFVSLSIDPLNDTPAALKAFATQMGADAPGWSFLTGRPQDIDRVAQRLRLFDRSKADARQPSDHATSLWLVDRQGRLMQRYAGQVPDTARLAREIAQLAQLAR